MNDIANLRQEVDSIDDQILSALCERVNICKAIGDAKKKQNKPIRDVSREKEIFKKITAKASELGLNSSQVEAVYREIVNMCSSVQE